MIFFSWMPAYGGRLPRAAESDNSGSSGSSGSSGNARPKVGGSSGSGGSPTEGRGKWSKQNILTSCHC
jgi:hypothetical protein